MVLESQYSHDPSRETQVTNLHMYAVIEINNFRDVSQTPEMGASTLFYDNNSWG